MTDLKLGKLPDRTPVRLTLTISPALNRALQIYAELYRENYGHAEPVAELIPYMLESFLSSDRTYAKALRGRPNEPAQVDPAKSMRRKQRASDTGNLPPES